MTAQLYDSLKYDSLHNRTFLETIFGPPKQPAAPASGTPSSRSSRLHKSEKQSTLAAATELAEQAATDTTDTPVDGPPKRLKELYKCAKELFDLSACARS